MVRHLRPPGFRTITAMILAAAVWGMVVDGDLIPILAPTGNSPAFQASTAAAFAVLGILFGPATGAAGGLVRDGSGAVRTLVRSPALMKRSDFGRWVGREVADILEDVVLGLIPGIVGLRTRRLSLLAAVAGATAWLSLPALVTANTLVDGHVDQVWTALQTATGNWDQPVDPSLTVYGLLTGGMTAFALAHASTRPRSAQWVATVYLASGLLLLPLGARI